ncbi:hypothetical protein HPB51_024304 [Rhipicephalus microplus]|uniref:Sulfotransferase domain-containing protein n=1 Tax=Rhipicephalus microplus TaxID=6941 RepID=A0A9J6EVA0_RHIMP|nr:hypothetical protein HPB51_024304 [Rhipicephalus microplus]
MIDGDYYSSYFNPDVVRQALRFIPGRGDIVQMAFPASGTHWMQQITQLIVHGGRSASSYREFASRFQFLEYVGTPAGVESTQSPRFLPTHLQPGQITVAPEAKYIYVARNPWDVCASLYDLQGELRGPNGGQTFDEFVSLFLEGLAGPGDYFEHVRAAFQRKDEPNVFFVTGPSRLTGEDWDSTLRSSELPPQPRPVQCHEAAERLGLPVLKWKRPTTLL